MKPNGKLFAVRVAFFALCAVAAFSAQGNAETVHGRFNLNSETRWGQLLLAPGKYEFTIDDQTSTGAMITVRSDDSLWSGVVLAESVTESERGDATRLVLAKSDTGYYVRSLYLADSGVVLTYGMPKAGKFIRLAKQEPSVKMASASGGQ